MAADVKVAILGAGFAGLCMGQKLKAAGETSFVILEKASEVGGTWRENTYPGCGCDIPSHLYSYSFEPNPDWPEIYSAQPDILAYIKGVAEKHGLYSHLRFDSEVVGAVWDEADQVWRIRIADGTKITAEAFVTAWGQLNRPKLPPIEGRESFAGTAFHSANWRNDLDLTGKKVAVIGNGASAIQFVPEVAKVAGHLTVFQRSPSWIVPRMNRPYTDEEKGRFRSEAGFREHVRQSIFDMAEERLAARRAGVPLDDPPIPLVHLHAQVQDPVLRAKLTPDYVVGCKRVLISNDFYPALTQPNVTLVTDPIARMTPQGVVDATGALHEVDVVIYATGFETKSFAGETAIVGANALNLAQAWAKGPEAYLGLTVAGFPNLFMMYGPNTNLGHNSIIYMIEAQADHVIQALAAGAPVSVKPQVMTRYNDDIQAQLANTPWAGSCTSWYKTPEGKILNNWPSTARAYADAVARFDLADYELLTAKVGEPAE